jgi:hypothetical protein
MSNLDRFSLLDIEGSIFRRFRFSFGTKRFTGGKWIERGVVYADSTLGDFLPK